MPRRTGVTRRELKPDSVFNSGVVTKFINMLMHDGKKAVTEKVFYGAMALMHERTGRNPAELFQEAVGNVMPHLEVRPRRVGGATYQIPMEVSVHRQLTLAFRWMIDAARHRQEKTMTERLAGELLEAANHEGGAMKKREDVHRMAAANKAYAHYRW